MHCDVSRAVKALGCDPRFGGFDSRTSPSTRPSNIGTNMEDKWGRQGFLNPVDSRDDGWYKFATEFTKDDRKICVNTQFTISDCSNKAYLEFDVRYLYFGTTSLDEISERQKEINARRKKVKELRDAVAEWAEETLAIYDKYEDALKSIKKEAKKNGKKKGSK
jgi:hypothetical protein